VFAGAPCELQLVESRGCFVKLGGGTVTLSCAACEYMVLREERTKGKMGFPQGSSEVP
jgi:hypothetical protein